MGDNANSEFIIVSFPNGTEGATATLRNLRQILQTAEIAETFPFEIPILKVGTLEKLIAASDLLARTDGTVESLVRKIERAYSEVVEANSVGEELKVEDVSTHTFLTRKFKWDGTKYQSSIRQIEDLIRVITATCTKLDEELKSSLLSYQEIKHEMSALQRKRGGNLMANVTEYLLKVKPEVFIDTEYLTHVLVVVSRNQEETFIEQYETLASDAVGYGPENDRQSILGSPVVPYSARKIGEDTDGFVLYIVIILRNYKEVYSQALQKARYAVRERNLEIQLAATSGPTYEEKYSSMENDFNEAKSQLKRWVKIHFAEAFSCWMHLKLIRTFVESVLLYGLPVDFVTAIIFLGNKKQNEKKLREKLEKFYMQMVGEVDLGLAGEFTGSMALQKKEAFYPYVSFAFRPLGE